MSKELPGEVGEELKGLKRLFTGIINPKKRVLLMTFSRTGRVMQSCEAAGVHWTTHYHWKKHDKKYLAAFQAAEQIAADFMEDEIHRRAFDGFDHPVTYEGKITTTYREYSDNLAMFRLKKVRPEYRENYLVNNFSGPVQLNVSFDQKAIDPLSGDLATEQGRAVDQARILEDRRRDDDGFDPEKH